MANKAISLIWYAKTARGWRHFPVVFQSSKAPKAGAPSHFTPRKIKHAYVIDQEQEVHYPEGRYQLRQYAGSQLVYTNLSTKNPDAALAEYDKAVFRRKRDLESGKVPNVATRKTLQWWANEYILDLKKQNHQEAARHAKRVLDEFIALCRCGTLSGIKRQHVTAFHEQMRKATAKRQRGRALSDRTIFNNDRRLRSFLKFAGVDMDFMPKTPKFDKKVPTTYNSGQLDALLPFTKGSLTIAVLMGWKLGLREKEIAFSEWGDINWHTSVFKVQSKSKYGFKVKDSEQRLVPIAGDLLAKLKEHKHKSKCSLITATSQCKPNGGLLVGLKRAARRAGLNCGHCDGCKSKYRECELFNLHKLRRTWMTTLLRNGFDIKTTQDYAGHSSMSSTMRYLKAIEAESKEAHDKLNAVQW